MKYQDYVERTEQKTGKKPTASEVFLVARDLYLTTSGPDAERGELLYDLAKRLADRWLSETFGLSWDDMPDVNSLWDVHDEMTKTTTWEQFKKAVVVLVKERINEGF